MQFAFFYLKDIKVFLWKTVDFVKYLELRQIAGGREGHGVMFFESLWRNAYENRYVIHPLPLHLDYNK